MADPLDDLYETGATAGLRDALPGRPRVEQIPLVALEGGEWGVRVNVHWSYAQMKIECTRDTWNFLNLHIYDEDDRREGLYGTLVDSLSELSRDLGVKRWIAQAADEESLRRLLSRGGWEADGMQLSWEL